MIWKEIVAHWLPRKTFPNFWECHGVVGEAKSSRDYCSGRHTCCPCCSKQFQSSVVTELVDGVYAWVNMTFDVRWAGMRVLDETPILWFEECVKVAVRIFIFPSLITSILKMGWCEHRKVHTGIYSFVQSAVGSRKTTFFRRCVEWKRTRKIWSCCGRGNRYPCWGLECCLVRRTSSWSIRFRENPSHVMCIEPCQPLDTTIWLWTSFRNSLRACQTVVASTMPCISEHVSAQPALPQNLYVCNPVKLLDALVCELR